MANCLSTYFIAFYKTQPKLELLREGTKSAPETHVLLPETHVLLLEHMFYCLEHMFYCLEHMVNCLEHMVNCFLQDPARNTRASTAPEAHG